MGLTLHQRRNHGRNLCLGSGVPQVSVLDPVLFIIYMNNNTSELNSTVRLFADDTIVYLVIKSQGDARKLQQDLDRLGSWEREWRMEFHPDKYSLLSITRSKATIHFEYRLHGQSLEHIKIVMSTKSVVKQIEQ